MSLINKYFKDTKDLKEKYGQKSIVFIQVGAFYEVYGLLDPDTNQITGSDISAFSSLCELTISKKNVCVGKQNVLMAGVRDYMIDKYLRKMQGFGYTIAVYSQDEKAAGTTRSLTGIFSPGTFFSSESQELTNNTMCLWFEKIKKTIVVGISNIDIYTGKSFVFEYNQEFSTTPEAYDELERYISIYQPSEIIVIHNLNPSLIQDILHFVDLNTECRHIIDYADKHSPHKQKVDNCEKQTYQHEIINKYFDIVEDSNLSQFPIGTQSYCYLLDFIFQHNPDLTRKIQKPIFENCTERLLLGNHSLKQLNIISSSLSGGSGSNGSVVGFLNQCRTPMGKRKFNYMMVNPLTDAGKLEKEYDYCEHVMEKNDINTLRDMLSQMRDLEKLSRKTALKKLTPSDCFHMCFSLGIVEDIYSHLQKDTVSMDYLFSKIPKGVNIYAREIAEFITGTLILDKIKDKNTLSFDDNFIKEGHNEMHDKCVEQWYDSYDILIGIQTYFDERVAEFEKKKKNKQTEYVKIHTTEKSGNSIVCTSRRATILKEQLKGKTEVDIPYYSRYAKQSKSYKVDVSKIELIKSTASNVTIMSSEIKKLCNLIRSAKDSMLTSLNSIYGKFLSELFERYTDKLDEIVRFIALVDYSYTRAFIAQKYNLCKPTIKTGVQKSFFDIKGVRHILIENLLRNEHYVTNDLSLDSDNRGVLLYGTNAVGKSSFIKAIGITIVMAQAGFYVPCNSLTFFPYKHIFTRILGNDNLFKGLSSFAVEMLELKTILNMATKDSLILGDELCSGTESSSAMSIFLSGIQHLYKEESNFIFATHFHEITDFEEVLAMDKMLLMHMAVHYDKAKDKLVYDRKLMSGPGQSMYGLEVCKALHLPFDFLENANALRNKYNPQTGSILEWRQSRYNSKKLRGLCEECNIEFSTEVHHVAHQKDADKNGYIGSFHKNSLANLRSLCEKCHQKEHHSSTSI
jgi:DNA mismatch repair protein MutS